MDVKRYLLFAGDTYYPLGGWSDFQASFETLGEAIAAAETERQANEEGWFQVVDGRTGEVVESGHNLAARRGPVDDT